jgi:hypothetical protein
MDTLKRGSTSAEGILAIAELPMVGSFASSRVEASRHKVPGPARLAPVRSSWSGCVDVGGIEDGDRERAAVPGPRRDDIEWEGIAARVDGGLLAAERLGRFGLRRIAGDLDRD